MRYDPFFNKSNELGLTSRTKTLIEEAKKKDSFYDLISATDTEAKKRLQEWRDKDG